MKLDFIQLRMLEVVPILLSYNTFYKLSSKPPQEQFVNNTGRKDRAEHLVSNPVKGNFL